MDLNFKILSLNKETTDSLFLGIVNPFEENFHSIKNLIRSITCPNSEEDLTVRKVDMLFLSLVPVPFFYGK